MAQVLTDLLNRPEESGLLGFRALQRLRAGRAGTTRDPFETMFKMTPKRLQALFTQLQPAQVQAGPIKPTIGHSTPVGPGGLKKYNELQVLEGDFAQKSRDFDATANTVREFEQAMAERQQAYESGELTKPEGTTFAFEAPGAAGSKALRERFLEDLTRFSKVLNLSGQVFQGAPGEFQGLQQMLQKAIQSQQSVAGTFSGMAAAGGEAAGLTAFNLNAQSALAPHLAAAGEFSQATMFPFFTRGGAGQPAATTTPSATQLQARSFAKNPFRRF